LNQDDMAQPFQKAEICEAAATSTQSVAAQILADPVADAAKPMTSAQVGRCQTER
jgi:hypothetical protein